LPTGPARGHCSTVDSPKAAAQITVFTWDFHHRVAASHGPPPVASSRCTRAIAGNDAV
jgi:hypothetical protein